MTHVTSIYALMSGNSQLCHLSSRGLGNEESKGTEIIGKYFYPITQTIFEVVLVSEIQNSGTSSFREHFEIINALWNPVNKT